MRISEIVRQSVAAFLRDWKTYLGIHVAASVISLAALAPLYTVLSGWLILASGQAALTDQDILKFTLSPLGLLVMAFICALFVTTLVFEQSALFVAAYQRETGKNVSLPGLGRFLLSRAGAIFLFALRAIALAALTGAPFLAAAAFIFARYLTEFDINYYLSETPPVFWRATGAILALVIAMLWPLTRVMASWFVALPLLLAEGESPGEAMRRGRSATGPVRTTIAVMLMVWLGVTLLLFSVTGGLLDLGVSVSLAVAGDSLQTLAYLVGAMLATWSVANLGVSFFSNSILSIGILRLFRELFPQSAGISADALLTPPVRSTSLRLSARLLATLFVVGVFGASVVLVRAYDRFGSETGVEIIAHRGASSDAPENTLAAMEEAIRQGADWVEIDVQETRDGHIVVIHDRDLKKVGGSDLRVWDTPLADLQSVDIGSRVDERFSNERVPTLRQVLALCRNRVGVLIELKYYGNETQLEQRVVEIVESERMQDNIKAMSLKYDGVQALKALRPDWEVGLLSSVALGNVTRLNAAFFAVNGNFAGRSFVRQAQQRARGVLVWTINDPVQMSAMMSKGVNGIITDKPGLAREIQLQRSQLTMPERFMIQFAGLLGKRVNLEQ